MTNDISEEVVLVQGPLVIKGLFLLCPLAHIVIPLTHFNAAGILQLSGVGMKDVGTVSKQLKIFVLNYHTVSQNLLHKDLFWTPEGYPLLYSFSYHNLSVQQLLLWHSVQPSIHLIGRQGA